MDNNSGNENAGLDPRSEIDFIKRVVEKTTQRIDGQAFHVVHWGAIVLLWYPLSNFLIDREQFGWAIGVGVGSVLVGMLLSFFRGWKASGRLPSENTFISRQLHKVFLGCIGSGMVLSAVCPSAHWIEGENIPVLWGLIYANLAFMIGVVYHRDFVLAGVFIFAGSIAAMFLQDVQGYILGPVMGLGMIVPGLRAEARLKSMLGSASGAEHEEVGT